jgi:hypothetical protein
MSFIKRLSLAFFSIALMAACAANQTVTPVTAPTLKPPTQVPTLVPTTVPTPAPTSVPTAIATKEVTTPIDPMNYQIRDNTGADTGAYMKGGKLFVKDENGKDVQTLVYYDQAARAFNFKGYEPWMIQVGTISDGSIKGPSSLGFEVLEFYSIPLSQPQMETIPVYDASGNKIYEYQAVTMEVAVIDKQSQTIKPMKTIVYVNGSNWGGEGKLSFTNGGKTITNELTSNGNRKDRLDKIKIGKMIWISNLFGGTLKSFQDGQTEYLTPQSQFPGQADTPEAAVFLEGALLNLDKDHLMNLNIPTLEEMKTIATSGTIPNNFDLIGLALDLSFVTN